MGEGRRRPVLTTTLPYPARNELRWLIRRYFQLNGTLSSWRQASHDLLTLTDWMLSRWAAPQEPAPDRAERLHEAIDWLELSQDGPVRPLLSALADTLGLSFTDAHGKMLRARSPLLMRQNSAHLGDEHREVFAAEGWSSDQFNPNLWHVYGRSWWVSPYHCAKRLSQHLDPLSALSGLVVHDDATTLGIIARLLMHRGGRSVSQTTANARAQRWMAMFRPTPRFITNVRDPGDITQGNALSGDGYVARVTIVIGRSDSAVGHIRELWYSMAD